MNPTIAAVLDALDHVSLSFQEKPLLIGGMAMEYYGMRKAGCDIDLVITDADYQRLARLDPNSRKDIWGDLGIVVGRFEIWRSIALLDYDFYKHEAIDEGDILVVSLDRLLLMRVLAMEVEKYRIDLDRIKQLYYDRYTNAAYYTEMQQHLEDYQRSGGTIFGGQYTQTEAFEEKTI